MLEALRRLGCPVAVLRTSAEPGDAERLAREAEPEFDAIVAAGGDGTLNAVANGIAAAPRPLGLLPFGTVNLLARELGLPHDPEALAHIVAMAAARPIWPGRVGDRLFLSVASAGIDADVVAALDPRLKARLGRLAFVPAVLRQLRHYRPHDLKVEIDGVAHRAAAVIAANGRYYAGPFVSAPGARVTEPSLDFVLLPRADKAALLRYAAALLRGRLSALPDVRVVRGRTATLAADRDAPVEADGEIVGRLPVIIGVADRPLPFLGAPAPTGT